MDGERFDAVVRSWGAAADRRSLLRRLAIGAGVLAAGTAGAADAAKEGPKHQGRPTNLCCKYLCSGDHPSRPSKRVCLSNITPGKDRCQASFDGCSFHGADFVENCSDCHA